MVLFGCVPSSDEIVVFLYKMVPACDVTSIYLLECRYPGLPPSIVVIQPATSICRCDKGTCFQLIGSI